MAALQRFAATSAASFVALLVSKFGKINPIAAYQFEGEP